MYTVTQILSSAGIKFEKYSQSPAGGVFLTQGNQLIGSYSDLRRFQGLTPAYFGWQVHHIVEAQDLERLGVAQLAPPYEQQVCVILPERAHIGRINSLLRNQNPIGVRVKAPDLLRAYRDAYSLMGDYCGGGEGRVRQELVAIVIAVFRAVGL